MLFPQGDFLTGTSTICALSTPWGNSIRAIVRISGQNALKVCGDITGVQVELLQHLSALPVSLHLHDFCLPNCTATVYHAPRSYTGEDCVELHMPGSPVIVNLVLNELIKRGCRIAKAGEFTRRAFENGRLDLSQAASVVNLIHSSDEAARRGALAVLTGRMTEPLLKLRKGLIEILFRIEAELDFADEEIEHQYREVLFNQIEQRLHEAKELSSLPVRASGRLPRFVIAGAPNAGKSTLFNLLSGLHATLSPIAGTTRDALRAEINIGDLRFELWDTAGVQHRAEGAAAMAIQGALELSKSADAILFMFSHDALDFEITRLIADLGRPILWVCNKCDASILPPDSVNRMHEYTSSYLSISATSGAGIVELKRRISEMLASIQSPTIHLSDWQVEAVLRAQSELSDALNCAKDEFPLEIVAEHLRASVISLDILEGKDVTNELLDRIFSTFCIGK